MLLNNVWEPGKYGWETYTRGTIGLSVPMIFMDRYNTYNNTINYQPTNLSAISSFNSNSYTDSPWLTTQHY